MTRERQFQAVVLALTAAVGLWGLRWGLPRQAVLEAVSPPGLEGPAFWGTLSESWAQMHQRLGPNLSLNPDGWKSFSGVSVVEAGWKTPPEVLLNSYRSFHLRSVHDDETTFLLALSRMRPDKLDFRHHVFSYGAVYIYSLGAWLAGGAVAQVVTLKRGLAPYLAEPALMGAMYWWGRLLSVLAAAATGLLLLRIGSRHFRLSAGLWAAALFVACPGVVVQAHLMKNHVFWSFFALWTLHLCLNMLEGARLRDYVAAGAVSGLAVGSFLPAWPACVAIALTAALRARSSGEWLPELKGLAAAAAASLGVFLITNPPFLLDFHEAMQEIRVLGGLASQRSVWTPLSFSWHALRRSLTSPAWLWLIAGVVWALSGGRRDPKRLLAALVFLAAWASLAVTGANFEPTRSIRYFLGWLAPGLLLAGELAEELRARAGAHRTAVTAVFALIACHVALSGLAQAHNFHLDGGPASNNLRAGRWIEETIPAGETVGLLNPPSPSRGPYFRYDRYRLVIAEPEAFAKFGVAALPRYLVVSRPDHDDRPRLGGNLGFYEPARTFERERLLPWLAIDPTSTTANAVIDVYKLAQ